MQVTPSAVVVAGATHVHGTQVLAAGAEAMGDLGADVRYHQRQWVIGWRVYAAARMHAVCTDWERQRMRRQCQCEPTVGYQDVLKPLPVATLAPLQIADEIARLWEQSMNSGKQQTRLGERARYF